MTFERRQGRAGWETEPREEMPCIGVDDSGLPDNPIPLISFPKNPSTSTRSRNAFPSVVVTVPASHISFNNCATTSYPFSMLCASNGVPRNSSSTSITRCRNSSASNGGISDEVVRKNRRLSCLTLKRRVDGLVLGRYMRAGRGVGWFM